MKEHYEVCDPNIDSDVWTTIPGAPDRLEAVRMFLRLKDYDPREPNPFTLRVRLGDDITHVRVRVVPAHFEVG